MIGGGGGRVHDRGILDSLESLDPEPFESTVWRVTRKGRDPVRGAIASGRWNSIGEFEAIYTALVPEGALAEVGYRLSLEPIWPSKIQHEIHQLKVKGERLLRFKSVGELAALGVDISKYASFEYLATQAIAAAAHFLECDGMIVPSARFDGANAVLFLDRMQSQPELIHSETIDWDEWRRKRK